jgi:Zn-finger nucleic acid-binding protein
MTKYRISSGQNNRLDLCANCDEVWLDRGEWDLLKSLNLGAEMPKVFTEEWQRKIRKKVSEESRRQRFVGILGEDVVGEADKISSWLKDSPQRTQILQYLNYE